MKSDMAPMQQIIIDDKGRPRFRQNRIVDFLLEEGPFDMNKLAMMEFSNEDRTQFAQLIGYSIGGYGELPYVSDASYKKACAIAAAAQAVQEPLDDDQ